MKLRIKALSLLTCIPMLAMSVTGCQPSVYEPHGEGKRQKSADRHLPLLCLHRQTTGGFPLPHGGGFPLHSAKGGEHFSRGKLALFSPLLHDGSFPHANGAENQTLSQMEAVLGDDRESLNRTMAYYREALTSQSP